MARKAARLGIIHQQREDAGYGFGRKPSQGLGGSPLCRFMNRMKQRYSGPGAGYFNCQHPGLPLDSPQAPRQNAMRQQTEMQAIDRSRAGVRRIPVIGI